MKYNREHKLTEFYTKHVELTRVAVYVEVKLSKDI